MKVFLDDIRFPQECLSYMYTRIGALNPIYAEDWIVARTYEDFVFIVEKHIDEITHISFDHDLDDEHYLVDLMDDYEKYEEMRQWFKHKTGADCAQWMKDYYQAQDKLLPIIFCHSMNPVGHKKIKNIFFS